MANGTLAASQIEMLSQSGTGIITITPPATNTNRAITLPDAAGAIVVSGTTPSLNGITFPATQVASADANTLDDYEEGTWTPTVAFGGNSVSQTYNTQTGNYTKIGRQVFVQCFVNMSDKGSSTGDATITGLPFTSNSGGTANNGGSMAGYFNMAGITLPLIGISPSESRISLRLGGSTGDAFMTHANFSPGLVVIVAQYFV
jgi:hypothetical protein